MKLIFYTSCILILSLGFYFIYTSVCSSDKELKEQSIVEVEENPVAQVEEQPKKPIKKQPVKYADEDILKADAYFMDELDLKSFYRQISPSALKALVPQEAELFAASTCKGFNDLKEENDYYLLTYTYPILECRRNILYQLNNDQYEQVYQSDYYYMGTHQTYFILNHPEDKLALLCNEYSGSGNYINIYYSFMAENGVFRQSNIPEANKISTFMGSFYPLAGQLIYDFSSNFYRLNISDLQNPKLELCYLPGELIQADHHFKITATDDAERPYDFFYDGQELVDFSSAEFSRLLYDDTLYVEGAESIYLDVSDTDVVSARIGTAFGSEFQKVAQKINVYYVPKEVKESKLYISKAYGRDRLFYIKRKS